MRTVLLAEHHRYRGVFRVGSHHIAAQFRERGWRTLWLSHPRSWLHRLMGPLPPRLVDQADGVRELIPRVPLPYIGVPLLGTLVWGRRWLAWPGCRRLFRRAGLERVDLLWVSDFTVLPILDWLPAERVVFRFFDHIDAFRRMPSSIFGLVRHYLPRADLVVASSRAVQEDLHRRGITAEYLPNGVDPDRLAPPPAAQTGQDGKAGGTPEVPPRVVYVGALAEWFDLEAVELWARHLPEVTFEIAGPNPRGLSSALANIRFLGPVPYEEVPRLLAGARCGLIPFRVTPLTLGVHPLKLYEYLAAGCPVLSADLPEVAADSRGVFKYRQAEEGLAILRQVLDQPWDRQALGELVQAHTWAERLQPYWPLLEQP
jgi:glycosyltransferase involved in cell wall biosynthesis